MKVLVENIIEHVDADNLFMGISIFATFLVGVLGIVVNAYYQRKNNSIRIITEKRIERRGKTHDLVTQILHYSDLNYLEYVDSDDERKRVIDKLSKSVSNLRAIYTGTFIKDVEMCERAQILETSVCEYLKKSNKANANKVDYDRNAFIKLADIYIQTEWSRIKMETIGKNRCGSSDEFRKQYSENEKKFNENIDALRAE